MANGENKYFSVVAMFIMFRETLEAAVIVSILLQVMRRIQPKLVRQVWWGSALGILVSVGVGAIFVILYYVASAQIFKGDAKYYFKAVMSWFAVIFITWLAFCMLRFYGLEAKYERKLREAAAAQVVDSKSAAKNEQRTKWSVWLLAFAAVFREGVETVVFLGGITAGTPPSAIPLAAFVGLLMGLAVGAFVYYTGRQMKDLMWFFVLSTLFLLFIAAGLVGWGASDFQQTGSFGRWSVWYQERDWWNVPLWDIGGCCSDSPNNPNKFFPMMRAIIGYQDRPTALEVMLYLAYWFLVIVIGIWKWKAGSLFDADYKYHKHQAALAAAAKQEGKDGHDVAPNEREPPEIAVIPKERPKTLMGKVQVEVAVWVKHLKRALKPLKRWVRRMRGKKAQSPKSSESSAEGEVWMTTAPADKYAMAPKGLAAEGGSDLEAGVPQGSPARSLNVASTSQQPEVVPEEEPDEPRAGVSPTSSTGPQVVHSVSWQSMSGKAVAPAVRV